MNIVFFNYCRGEGVGHCQDRCILTKRPLLIEDFPVIFCDFCTLTQVGKLFDNREKWGKWGEGR